MHAVVAIEDVDAWQRCRIEAGDVQAAIWPRRRHRSGDPVGFDIEMQDALRANLEGIVGSPWPAL